MSDRPTKRKNERTNERSKRTKQPANKTKSPPIDKPTNERIERTIGKKKNEPMKLPTNHHQIFQRARNFFPLLEGLLEFEHHGNESLKYGSLEMGEWFPEWRK